MTPLNPSNRLPGLLTTACVVILFAVVAAGLAGFVYATRPWVPGARDSVVIEVTRGQSPAELARALEREGVIGSAARFLWLGRITRSWSKLKAGEYRVSAALSPLEILRVIESGVSVPRVVTLREGINLYEVATQLEQARLVEAKAFWRLARNPAWIASLPAFRGMTPPANVEGYLWPETYYFSRTQSAEEIIAQMVATFAKRWELAWDSRAQELGLSRHEVVTLASIIEKETGAPQERPLISSVFHNRLRKRMRLQSDPTTIYGMWERYTGNIRRSDLLTPSPYNTYTIPALPVGPIGNPGIESLRAALYPAESNYLYFVSENNGTHRFSATLEEHNAAVRAFQLNPQAREGKSWRDLVKPAPSR